MKWLLLFVRLVLGFVSIEVLTVVAVVFVTAFLGYPIYPLDRSSLIFFMVLILIASLLLSISRLLTKRGNENSNIIRRVKPLSEEERFAQQYPEQAALLKMLDERSKQAGKANLLQNAAFFALGIAVPYFLKAVFHIG